MKATIKPPREGLVANVQRRSNPFVSDAGPDWVPNHTATETVAPDATTGRKPVPQPPPPPRQRNIDEADFMVPGAGADLRNSPPAVPRKPLSLSSQRSRRDSVRRSSTMQLNASEHVNSPSSPTEKVRKAPTDLLGDATGEQIEWRPLLPQR